MDRREKRARAAPFFLAIADEETQHIACATPQIGALLPHVRALVTLASQPENNQANGGDMKNPLDSLWGTVISGLVLTFLLYNAVRYALQ